MHAGCEQPNGNVDQYELVLELTLRDAHYEEGIFLYGLSAPGDLLWIFGLPAGRVAACADLDWRLYVQATQEVVGSGQLHCERSHIVGLYYGGGDMFAGKVQMMRPFLIEVVGGVCTGVRNSLASKPDSEWARIAKAHEEWRIARGDVLPYKLVKQMAAASASPPPTTPAPTAEPVSPKPPVVGISGTATAIPPAAPVSLKPPVVISDNSSVAVVIGIGDYVFLGKIPGCEADATTFAEAFCEARQMNPRNVVLMTDSGDKSHLPTKSMIESRIRMCVNEVKPDGMALVYFSGHAVTQDGQALLVPKDCEAANGIPVNTVVAMLRESPARDKVLIIDACHAGAAQKGVLVIAKDTIKAAEGVAMFLSCDKEENSYPLENGEKSVYTDAFLRCLQESASGSTAITARLLEGKIEDKMREWRLQTGKRQTPQLLISGDGDVTLIPVGTKR